nr:Hypothetical protein [Pseudomonas aeruginosa]
MDAWEQGKYLPNHTKNGAVTEGDEVLSSLGFGPGLEAELAIAL